ncbi:hypothetical protein [Psychroserpens sp. SPM9]|uniref:hypothetical protein n=1 Tax=Psychroserpens sp. SPM9 TaxID=2975598 RepID=UPI0021A938E1|nr:hypothetical protein [Psychroserpens sp. SPM9]MDG5493204.1 hypothetical protein [Psychroserpens sp. SPM9]
MKTLHQINCEIFDIVKNNELILFTELPKMVGVDQDLVLQSIGKLKNDHGLISVKSHKLSLSEKGLSQKSFESYLESLKPKKEYWFTKYQMTYLPFFIFFGFFGIYKHFDNKELKSDYETLKSDFEILTKKYDSVIKQTEELPKQILNDSSRTKNLTDLNKDKKSGNE